MEKFTITLATARKNVELSQAYLARKMEVSRQIINNWEKGKITPGIPDIDVISKITRVPQDYLFYQQNLL